MAATKKQRTDAHKSTIDLFSWNKWLAIIYAIQGIALIVASASRSLPVFTTFLTQNSLDKNGPLVQASQRLFDVNITAWLVCALGIAAIIHALMAGVYRTRYEAELTNHQNRMRWLSFGVMSVSLVTVIALLSGISDVVALVALAGLLVIKSIAGYLTEVNRQQTSVAWLHYLVAAGSGTLPWLLVGWTVVSALINGTSHVPTFVYWLCGTLLAGLVAHGVLMYFVMKQKGMWGDAYTAERAYLVLGVVTQTLVVWQVFAGALRP